MITDLDKFINNILNSVDFQKYITLPAEISLSIKELGNKLNTASSGLSQLH